MVIPKLDTFLLSVEDGVALLTLNRPEKLNAFNEQMATEMIAVLDYTDADDDIKAVIVTGAGRAFCAGADLSSGDTSFDYGSSADQDAFVDVNDVRRDGGGLLTLRIYRSLKPIIAAVNGPAVGIGLTMQLAMDIRMASENARFGFVFARRGIVPEACASFFLPRLVGLQQALEWCYSGRVFASAEALDGGLVRSVHAQDDLLPAAKALAREIVDNTAPVSVALIRQLMWRGLSMSHPMEAHMADSRAMQARGRAADSREGIASFMERRPPVYPNKVSTDLPDIWPHWIDPIFE